MKLKSIAIATLVGLSGMTATSVMAEEASNVTANIGATSNYLWRGEAQTGGDAAISGGIDYASDSGFYAGTWVSNANWSGDMSYELDFYGGYAGKINEDVDYDAGFIYYAYPDSNDQSDFSEVYFSLSFSGITLGAAVIAQAEGSAYDAGDGVYLSADYAFEVGKGTEIGLHLGQRSGDFYNSGEEVLDIGATVSKDGFTFGVSKTDDFDDTESPAVNDVKVYASYGVDFEL